ncbi:hypothetical protein V9L05_14605 [Bernardetia sp. Wsw4-3y2]|uniref:hypothetical protein n=1 Tax=Bernardetia sp. Wsw4-3y2 TaxID=3127471 RepID=UPI0030D36045
MIEKEFPVFAFEEIRSFGVSMQESKSDIDPLEEFLDNQGVEYKAKRSIFSIFVENLHQQYRRSTSSFYQIIRYENYILLEFLIEYYDYENIDEICFKIENSNKVFLEEGREGIKKMIKSIIKGKNNSSIFLKEYYTGYIIDFMLLIHKSKNPIQVEKTDQEQTLKITYKVDL